jgi:hypothetical protein
VVRIVGTVLLGLLGLVPRATDASSDLERRVREEVSRFHGTMGVIARNLATGERIAVNLFATSRWSRESRAR